MAEPIIKIHASLPKVKLLKRACYGWLSSTGGIRSPDRADMLSIWAKLVEVDSAYAMGRKKPKVNLDSPPSKR